MLNGYTLGNEKLSRERFANKYWMGGKEEYVYQFHTMDIADGKNERQQLLINNDRALHKLIRDVKEKTGKAVSHWDLDKVERRVLRSEKAIGCLIILQLLSFGLIIFWSKMALSLIKKKR